MEQNKNMNNDFEEIFEIVNVHSTMALANSLQERIIQKRNQRRIEYKARQAKAKKMRKQAILAIVASATILSVGVSHTIDAVQNRAAERSFNKTIAQAVTDNTYDTNVVLPNGAGYAWDYNTNDIAKDVLDNNKEIDIDTRIYGCYTNLREYRQDHFMDVIMRKMHELVTTSSDKYTEDEIKSCSFDTFPDYIASFGMTKEEYLNYFQEVQNAYAHNDTDKINELLQGLKGGSR